MLKTYELRNYNFKLIVCLLLLSNFGVVMINFANSQYTKKQLFGIGLSVIAMVIVSLIDYNTICKFWWVIYGINTVLLLLVILIGKNVNGAKRWIEVPGLGAIQPSEFAKIIMIVVVAYFLEKHKDDLNTLKTLVELAAICAVPVFLIVATDLSQAIDMTIILFSMIFVGGLSYKIIATVAISFFPVVFAVLFYVDHAKNVLFFKDYQVGRIKSFLHPGEQSIDSIRQQRNSIMAIGSGMLHGKLFQNSSAVTVKDANLVSEQHTDFIFSVVGEEFGFIGCVIFIAILILIMLQCIKMANYARNTSGMLIATGIAALICLQSFINIGVTTKLLPNTGLPLPFVSYGLSSLLSNFIGMGLVLNIGLQRRKY